MILQCSQKKPSLQLIPFDEQIVPINIKTEKEFCFDKMSIQKVHKEILSKMSQHFLVMEQLLPKLSGINDGASFLLANSKSADEKGLEPIARLVSYGLSGVPNDLMGEGPIPATKVALEKAKLTLDKIDLIESNEAFAAQAIAVKKGLSLNNQVTNVNGGAIALGHPVGATGAVLATKLIYELKELKSDWTYTMCIGGDENSNYL